MGGSLRAEATHHEKSAGLGDHALRVVEHRRLGLLADGHTLLVAAVA